MHERIRRGAWILEEKESEKSKIKSKVSSKKITKKILKPKESQSSFFVQDIDPKHYFYLNDGRIIKDLFELCEVLLNISEDTFNHHVNNERNDFSNWIRSVFGNKSLALKISKCKTKEEMVSVLKLV